MAKCDEGYPCWVCGGDVENITVSDLYLRYVLGMVDPETLHTAADRHIRCHPELAQFIVDPSFPAIVAEGPWSKSELDPVFVAERERLVTRGWRRLKEVLQQGLPIQEYPLPEVAERYREGE
jgi:hypothetical protein